MSEKLRQMLNDPNSYAAIYMYGSNGDGGLWKSRNVPAKYSDLWLEDLPIEPDNPVAYKTVDKYVGGIVNYVDQQHLGLFLYSVPNQDNRMGTGNGKTSSAAAMLNHYLYERLRLHLRGDQLITDNPCYFLKMNDLQTAFNQQFRGGFSNKDEAADRYFRIKDRASKVDLLVLDDIGMRPSSEAFTDELYSLLDKRVTDEKTTIYTSNIGLQELSDYIGDRVVSRIEGSTVAVPFKGKDHRRRVL